MNICLVENILKFPNISLTTKDIEKILHFKPKTENEA